MKVGDYIRTKQGIEKIKVVEENFTGDENCIFYATNNKEWNGAYNGKYNGFTNRNRTIIKSSPNIIDLIEEGDFINGSRITELKSNKNGVIKCMLDSDYEFITTITNEEIESVVTKEQFSQMEYRIGE